MGPVRSGGFRYSPLSVEKLSRERDAARLAYEQAESKLRRTLDRSCDEEDLLAICTAVKERNEALSNYKAALKRFNDAAQKVIVDDED